MQRQDIERTPCDQKRFLHGVCRNSFLIAHSIEGGINPALRQLRYRYFTLTVKTPREVLTRRLLYTPVIRAQEASGAVADVGHRLCSTSARRAGDRISSRCARANRSRPLGGTRSRSRSARRRKACLSRRLCIPVFGPRGKRHLARKPRSYRARTLNERGKRAGQAVIETNGAALVEYVESIPGRKSLCLEEGGQSSWLYEILSPHVHDLVVIRVVQKSQGSKDDFRDAFRAAEMLRLGNALPVFKEKGQFSKLRAHSDLYGKMNSDSVRVQCRLKALFRSRGVPTADGDLYAPEQREQWLNLLPVAYRSAAEVMYQQYDASCRAKLQAAKLLKKESHPHPISRILQTAPGMGGHQAPDGQADAGAPYRGHGAGDVEEQGGIRPGQVSRPKINARLCGEALTGTAPFRLEATAPESSKVRGVAPQIKLGRSSVPDTSIEERNSVLKPRYPGYAPSEYPTKPWPTEAPIEAWCPIFYGAYRGFNDYEEAPESPGRRIAREDLKTAASPRAVALTHRLAVREVAPRPVTSPDSVRSNEEIVRWTDKFVLDRTFDRSFFCPSIRGISGTARVRRIRLIA